MRQFSLILLLCAICFGSRAQEVFINGYYVTQDNDTVRGMIANRSDLVNFNSCIYKASGSAVPETFSSEDILAFGNDNGVAYHEFIYKDKNGSVLDGFFRLLVKGKLSLFTYDRRYFAVDSKNQIYEVTRSSTEVSGKVKEDYRGFGQLKLLMSDCEKTNESWLLKQYSNTNLKKIFLTYNECFGGDSKVFDRNKSQLKLDAGVQLSASYMIFSGSEPYINMDKKLVPSGGVFFSLSNPGLWDKVSLIVEGNYYHYSGHGFSVETALFSGPAEYNDAYLDLKAITTPVYFRIGRRYFFDFGIVSQFLISSNGVWRNETLSPGQINTSYPEPYHLPTNTNGFVGGAGMKFSVGSFPLRVSARYTKTKNGFGEFRSAQIGVALQLTKDQK